MCTTPLGPPSMSGASWFRRCQLQMFLKYWYACTPVFFSTLPLPWAALVTGYWRAHQYISTINCCSVKWDFAKNIPSLSPADFPQAVSLHFNLLQMHTKDYLCPIGTLCFTELLHTYLYLSVTLLQGCMFIGWLHAGQVLLVAIGGLCSETNQSVGLHLQTYEPRSIKILIFVALIALFFRGATPGMTKPCIVYVHDNIRGVALALGHVTRHKTCGSGL